MDKNIWTDWEITEKIGEGRFGEVYKAIKRVDEMTLSCAIKHASLPKNDDEVKDLIKRGIIKNANDANKYFLNLIENMKKEISIMQKFTGNPYIIDCFDYVEKMRPDNSGADFYIRMELAKDLNNYFKNRKPTEKEIIKMGIDICTALELCEQENIIHKDIKPSNIFVGSDGIYKLGDFGISSTNDVKNDDVEKNRVTGTYNYMAPEIYNKQKATSSTDLYSLGLVMYKLLNNNKLPFVGKDVTEADALTIRMLGRKFPMIKADLKLIKIINKTCSFEPEKRYKNATEMKKDLERIYGIANENSSKNISNVESLGERTISIYDTEKINSSANEISNSQIITALDKKTASSNKNNSNNNIENLKKLLFGTIVIAIILLLIRGCFFSEKTCETGYVNDNGVCVKGYYYCEAGYKLNKDNKCSKTTKSLDASVSYSCNDGYTLNIDTCVKSDVKEPKISYQCSVSGFALSGTECIKTVTTPAIETKSCPSGYTRSGSSCYKTGSGVSPTTTYSCPSGYTLSGTTCKKYDSSKKNNKTTYTCSTGTLSGNYCYTDATRWGLYYYCSTGTLDGTKCKTAATAQTTTTCTSGYTYDSSKSSCYTTTTATSSSKCSSGYKLLNGQCYKTSNITTSTTSYSCLDGMTLKGSTCYTSVTMEATPTTSCDKDYTFTGTLCVLNDIVDAKTEYSCLKKYTLNGTKCEQYELKNPKIQRN